MLSNELFCQSVINGYIKDQHTEGPIIGAAILESGMGVASTDSNGYFSFKLKPGTYQLTAKMLGYKSIKKEITLSEDYEEFTLFFYLESKPVEIEKVTIFGKKFTETEKYKTYELTTGDLKNIPVFIESDPIRAVQSLPGVTQSHDLSDLIFLRGGNFDETLITLDDVPVYNPHHAGGVYSIFNTDAIQREILYPSNYPIDFDNTLSGVLSINTKDGNYEKLRGVGSVGLLSARGFLEGNLGKGNFILSARRTYVDLLFNTFTEFPYYFYDINGKYKYPIDERNLVEVSFFHSKDIYEIYQPEDLGDDIQLDYKDEDLNWRNNIVKFKYVHTFEIGSYSISSYLSESYSGASGKTKESMDELRNKLGSEHTIIHNTLRDINVTTELNLKFTGQKLRFKINYNNYFTNYHWDIDHYEIRSSASGIDINGNLENVFMDFAPSKFKESKREDVISGSVTDEIYFSSKLSTILGYRFTHLASLNKSLHSTFIRSKYKFTNNFEATASFGRYYQYLVTKKDLIYSSTYAPFVPYFLPGKSNDIRYSNHYSLGITKYDLFNVMDLETEFYYKTRENLYSSNEVTNISTLVDGYATGVDLLLKKNNGFVTGWVSYSYSRSIKEGDYDYFANYDRTHTVKALANFNLSENWVVSMFWIYASGLPYTPAVGKYLSGLDYEPNSAEHGLYYGDGNFIWELYYGRKNTVRYSGYTRLDLGITGRFIWWGLVAKPYLQVLNVYRSLNAFDYDPRPDDTSVHDGSKRGSDIIPTIGVSIEF